jgi:cytochrome c556
MMRFNLSVSSPWMGRMLAVVLLFGAPLAGAAEEDTPPIDQREGIHYDYLEVVASILRGHVSAMRMILDSGEMRYSDNLVRHAQAIERAFGMIGPMEWHAAEAMRNARPSEANDLREQDFIALGEKSYNAIHALPRAAERYMRDRNKARLQTAINHMMNSCVACHSKLPAGYVPNVWRNLSR